MRILRRRHSASSMIFALRPAEALLYEWWPIASRRGLLRRLGVIPIEVRDAA